MFDPRAPLPCVTVPLWPLTLDRQCACGRDGCNAAGKHPRHHMAPLDGGGYGVLCGMGPEGSGIFVVDLDTKPDRGINGLDAFSELHKAHTGELLPDTLIVGTGGGGFHFYFKHPGYAVKNSTSKLGKGIDIKGEGGWVVGPGSPHKSGRPYLVLHSAEVATAPDWLLDWPGLKKESSALELSGGVPVNTIQDMSSPEGIANAESFRAECAGEIGNLTPGVQGERGHDRLWHVAKRGTCYYLLPADIAEAIIWEHWNPRCSPPYRPEERHQIARKCVEAIRTNAEPTPGPAPATWGDQLIKRSITGGDSDPEEVIALREHNPDHEYAIKVGDCIANGKLVSRSISELAFRLRRSPDWVGVLRYDVFADRIRAIDPPVKLDAEVKGLSDNDITSIRVWFEVNADTTAAVDAVRSAVYAASFASPVHPVRDYLYGLPAVDPAYLQGLAAEWFGATEPLDAELLTRFLVGAARRILFPGTLMGKLDTMLILQGEQGFFKSYWVKALFSRPWTNEQMPDLHSKDASQVIANGVWAQEIAELDKILRSDPTTFKDYLTREVDKFRPAYGREVVEAPRQCCFIGNSNDSYILRDPTGERRFWPVRVTRTIPIAEVEAARDRVWGAVMVLARQTDFRHWIDRELDADLLAALEARHGTLAIHDAWTESSSIFDYCAGRPYVTAFEVFRWTVCNGSADALSKYTKTEQRRIGDILRRMGAEAGSVRVDGQVIRAFKLPELLTKASPSPNEVRRRASVEPLRAVGT